MAEKSQKNEEMEQIRNAENKFQSYINRRNELNDMAKLLRGERDMLNAKHKEIKDEMKKTRNERDEIVAKMKEHKKLRNELQQQAKELIKARQQKKGEVFKNLPLRLEELKADVQMLEYRQETVPLCPQDENELIEKIREKKREFDDVKQHVDKQKELQIDITEKDQAIDELFKKADEQHDLVQKYYDESQVKHKTYIKMVHELSISIAESNKKHEEYIETRNEAQKNHEKAMEMRSKIMSVRTERRKRWKERKQIIKEQNIKARNAVSDKNKLKKIADKSLESLKKGEKISL
jgi:uncharacterized coiled-coil DUF342 family protein